MPLRLSRYVHMLPVGVDRVLILHAVSHLRLVVDRELAEMIGLFSEPREVDEAGFAALVERGVLTPLTPEAEEAAFGGELEALHGRDPDAMLEAFRRQAKEGGDPYWATGPALGLADVAPGGTRVQALLFGDCDIQMEAAFLQREAARRGIDLRVAATFPDDLRLASEQAHDVILIGALRARHTLTDAASPSGAAPHALFIAQARAILDRLREQSTAPILIDALPEPTVQPLGMAERGPLGHRNRFRLANLALEDLAALYPDVHVVDVAAALAAEGAAKWLDDGQVGYTHFGSPGWMLQRPQSEKAAVWDQFPDPAPLIATVEGNAHGREAIMARTHVDALVSVLGVDRKKCVILDLDGTLWPGVLAETGSPFAWSPETSGPFSYIGLYFGLHEALLSLKRRGVLLACVSKNDEALVRGLWTYPDHYPAERLLTPDDFVAWRVNWSDKATNIASLAQELGFALNAFLFIDDHPAERERVRQQLPDVEVWGKDPFALRRRLLSDPRLMTPAVSAESAARTEATRAQLDRQRHRAEVPDEAAFLASLQVKTAIAPLGPGHDLSRVVELFQRTTQFNTTGVRPSAGELGALIAAGGAVYAMQVSDRFGDHGLVGAAVISDGEVVGLALSCRVLGLGVEHALLCAVIEGGGADRGRIIETPRNGPVRNLYRDNGFALGEDGVWRLASPANGAG